LQDRYWHTAQWPEAASQRQARRRDRLGRVELSDTPELAKVADHLHLFPAHAELVFENSMYVTRCPNSPSGWTELSLLRQLRAVSA